VTACKRTVSGSVSLRASGSFHLSLTVLCAIGHQEYLALPDGPGGFRRSFTMIDVLRNSLLVNGFSPTGLSPSLVASSKGVGLTVDFDIGVLQPHSASAVVWAGPCSLAATNGVDVLFPFLRLLRCFSSPGSHPFG
jgi:hypothetical protein